MAQEMELLLQKSLRAVDRRRQIVFATILAVSVPMTWAFFRIIEAARAGDTLIIVSLGMVFLIFWTSTLTFVITLELMRIAKTILRAIELVSMPPVRE